MEKKVVLMLEDDNDDRYITRLTLSELGFDFQILFFSKSDELYQYLGSNEPPALILVEYNSVPENGVEVLKKIKSDERLNSIPVVVLSDNDFEKYRKEAYSFGASSYIRKPADMEATKQKIHSFFKYWLEVAEV